MLNVEEAESHIAILDVRPARQLSQGVSSAGQSAQLLKQGETGFFNRITDYCNFFESPFQLQGAARAGVKLHFFPLMLSGRELSTQSHWPVTAKSNSFT